MSTNSYLVPINESFFSIEGEGPDSGVPTYFIRLQGCSIRCPHCDSKSSWLLGFIERGNYREVTNERLIEMINEASKKVFFNRISITGGNPVEYSNIIRLAKEIKKSFPYMKLHLEHPGFFNIPTDDVMVHTNIIKCFDSVCFDIKSPHHFLDIPGRELDPLALMAVFEKNVQIMANIVCTRYTGSVDGYRNILKTKFETSIKMVFRDDEDILYYAKMMDLYRNQFRYSEKLLSPMFNKDNKMCAVHANSNFQFMLARLFERSEFRDCRISLQTHKFVGAM